MQRFFAFKDKIKEYFLLNVAHFRKFINQHGSTFSALFQSLPSLRKSFKKKLPVNNGSGSFQALDAIFQFTMQFVFVDRRLVELVLELL
jgi:hypothetical protein